jgi:hypothetical protein
VLFENEVGAFEVETKDEIRVEREELGASRG